MKLGVLSGLKRLEGSSENSDFLIWKNPLDSQTDLAVGRAVLDRGLAGKVTKA